MSFHFGIYRFGFLLALFITSFGIWLSTITNLTLSAHYVYYVKLSVTIRQILSTLLSYLFQILNLS